MTGTAEGGPAGPLAGVRVLEVSRADMPEFTYKARRWKDERQHGYKL